MFIEPIIIFLASIMPFNEQQANIKHKDVEPKQSSKIASDKDQSVQPSGNPLYRGGWDRN